MAPKRVAVIGAGASGLAAVKECLAAGLQVKCFEKAPYIGGIWHIYDDAEGSKTTTPMYKHCIINVSLQLLSFSDFPTPKGWPNFLPGRMVEDYLNMYADRFSVRPHVHLSHAVTKVSQNANTKLWMVRYRSPDGKEDSEEFDWVFICSGRYSKPKMPHFKGQETFTGELLHMENYWEPTRFANKRVIVVGAGASGSDAASELSFHATETYLSHRSGTHYVTRMNPRTLKPVDHGLSRLLFELVPSNLRKWMSGKFAAPTPPGMLPADVAFGDRPPAVTSSGFFERLAAEIIVPVPGIEAISGSDVRLSDGRVLKDIDTIICATGYDVKLEFLEDPGVFCRWPEGEEEVFLADKSTLKRADGPPSKSRAWLWKGMIPPTTEGIAFVGFVQITHSSLLASELQSRYMAALINSQTVHRLPPAPEMHNDIRSHYRTLTQFLPAIHYRNVVGYLDWLAEEAARARPVFWRVAQQHGYITAFKIYLGVMVPQQWRIVGRGTCDGALDVVLGKMG